MRILHVAHVVPPDGNTGVENYTEAVAIAQADSGHAVAVFARGGAGAEGSETRTENNGVLTVRVALGSGHQFGHKRVRWEQENRFAAFVKEWKPDVVHFQHLLLQSLGLPRIARRFGAARVLTLHDFWWTCPVVQRVDFRQNLCTVAPGRVCLACLWSEKKSKLIGRETVRRVSETPFVRRFLDFVPTADDLTDWTENSQIALNDIQTILAPSQFVADNLERFGLTHPNIVLSPYGITRPQETAETGDVPQTQAAPPSRPLRFGVIGTHPKKGVGVAIQAFRLLAPDTPARLLVFGGENDANAANVPHVEMRGAFSASERDAVFAGFDILLVPSLWWENAPFVMREAWARHKPVLASDGGGMAESINDNGGGLVFPVGDAPALAVLIRRLCDEPDLLPDLRNQIRPPVYMPTHLADLFARYEAALQNR